jgi:hypothetical protein
MCPRAVKKTGLKMILALAPKWFGGCWDGPLVLVNGLLSCKMVSFVGFPTITLVDNSFLRKINGAFCNKWKW